MPEKLTESTPGSSGPAHAPRRLTWALASVLLLGSSTAVLFAQNVPSALRTCAAETDAGQRLDCYDREMARLLALRKQPSAAVHEPDLPASIAATRASSSRPARAASSPPAQVSSPVPAQAPSSAPAQTPGSASAPHRSSLWNIFSAGGESQLTARITRLERWPDAMVLHLDNGQVWQQIGRASGDLGLQAGDAVKIEKHLGSYWLSSGHVTGMQVRLESQ